MGPREFGPVAHIALLADASARLGVAVPSWPERWFGKGMPSWSDNLVQREIAACGAVSSVPTGLAGPTLLELGPDHMRERFLRPLLTGEETWCQLFSEPDAGSDLAGLTTTAVLDGDEWVVNGQKVWNTSVYHADMGMLVARTNWDVPKVTRASPTLCSPCISEAWRCVLLSR